MLNTKVLILAGLLTTQLLLQESAQAKASRGIVATSAFSCRRMLKTNSLDIGNLRFRRANSNDPEADLQQGLALKAWYEIARNPYYEPNVEAEMQFYTTSYDPYFDPKATSTHAPWNYLSNRIGHSPVRGWGAPSELQVPDSKPLSIASPASNKPEHRIILEIMSERGMSALALGEAKIRQDGIAEMLLLDLEKLSNVEESSDSGHPMLRLTRQTDALRGGEIAVDPSLLANPIILALGKLKSPKALDTLERLFNGLGHYASEHQDLNTPLRYRKFFDQPSHIALIDSLYAINSAKAVELFINKMTEVQKIHNNAKDTRKPLGAPIWRYMNWPHQLWRRAMGAGKSKGIFSATDRKKVLEIFESFEEIEEFRNVGQ